MQQADIRLMKAIIEVWVFELTLVGWAQMVELFNISAEQDTKINAKNVSASISLYFGKKNLLDAKATLNKA